jgi:hypothetical protein
MFAAVRPCNDIPRTVPSAIPGAEALADRHRDIAVEQPRPRCEPLGELHCSCLNLLLRDDFRNRPPLQRFGGGELALGEDEMPSAVETSGSSQITWTPSPGTMPNVTWGKSPNTVVSLATTMTATSALLRLWICEVCGAGWRRSYLEISGISFPSGRWRATGGRNNSATETMRLQEPV